MPTDRSRDRHAKGEDGRPLKPARIIRPDPPELWDQLGVAVGPRKRSEIISDLIRRYLNGEPMPPVPDRS
jgi:hypothetical protein